jgi:hypothetical protein
VAWWRPCLASQTSLHRPLPSSTLQAWRGACTALRVLGCALCLAALAAGGSGPPLLHLALMATLLLAGRGHAAGAALGLAAAAGVGALYACGLRLVVRPDAAGRLGVALLRWGGDASGLLHGEGVGAAPLIALSFDRTQSVPHLVQSNESAGRPTAD